MSCNSSFIGIFKNATDDPIIGLCLGITSSGLDLRYYDANTGIEETISGSGDVLTCCSGGFAERVKGMSCNQVLIGVFIDGSGNPIFAKFDGVKSGIAVITYYDASTGLPFIGTVYICCCSANSDTLYGCTVVGVAGFDITMPNAGTAFTIAWDNTIHTIGWTQVGTLITFTDGSLFAGGEQIKITYTI